MTFDGQTVVTRVYYKIIVVNLQQKIIYVKYLKKIGSILLRYKRYNQSPDLVHRVSNIISRKNRDLSERRACGHNAQADITQIPSAKKCFFSNKPKRQRIIFSRL